MESVDNLLEAPEAAEDPLDNIAPEHYLNQVENPNVPVHATLIGFITDENVVFECQEWFKTASDEELLICNRYHWDERKQPEGLDIFVARDEAAVFDDIVNCMEGNYPKLIDLKYEEDQLNSYAQLVVNEQEALTWIRLNRHHLLPQLGEGMTPKAVRRAAQQQYHVKIGGTYWFEYHCNEADSSADADLWYHSHQQCKVLEMQETGDGKDLEERGYNGACAAYKVQFADGFTHTATEDELLTDRKEFDRPDPPAPPAQRKDKGRKNLDSNHVKGRFGEAEIPLDDPDAFLANYTKTRRARPIPPPEHRESMAVYARLEKTDDSATKDMLRASGDKELTRLNKNRLKDVCIYLDPEATKLIACIPWHRSGKPRFPVSKQVTINGLRRPLYWIPVTEALPLDDPDAMLDRMNEPTDVGVVYELLKTSGYNPDLPNRNHCLGIVCTGHPNDVKKFLIEHNVYNFHTFWSSDQNLERTYVEWPNGTAFYGKPFSRGPLRVEAVIETALNNVDLRP